MAQGNWSPEVCKGKPRCRLCNRVVLAKDMVRLDGVKPAHKLCADDRKLDYTVGMEIHPHKPFDEGAEGTSGA